MKKALAIAIALVTLASVSLCAAEKTPWWEQGKVRWFWGQWSRFQSGDDKVSWDEVMSNLRSVGAIVFVDDGMPLPDQIKRARIAHKYGIKYLGMAQVCEDRPVAEKIGARLAVNRRGLTSLDEQARGMRFDFGSRVPCPMDEKTANEWLLKTALTMAKSGVMDGLQIDWESYGATGYDQLGDYLCYCDVCWGDFAAKKHISETIAPADRYDWLVKQDLLSGYLGNQRTRLRKLYSDVAAKVRKVKADFVFAAYPDFTPGEWENSWRMEGAALGLNSPKTPFFVIDASHYNPDHTAPWWESGYTQMKALGLKHILGTWTGALFGDHPELDVSAAQWMYDAAISHDGYWVWFEHAFGPGDWQAYRTAEKKISATESRVGDFLMRGEQSNDLVVLTEQSGNPVLARNIVQRSYHLNKEYLVRVNNVNTDVPVSVLVRFPRTSASIRWSVTDPVPGLRFTTQDSPVWTHKDLSRGVFVTLEPRSETWLLLSPSASANAGEPLTAISGDPTRGHPERPKTNTPMPMSAAMPATQLLYTRQYQLNYIGGSAPSINPVLGTKISSVNADGSGNRDIYAIKGDCWSPVFSPDRTKIAFSCYVNGKGQIYVANADGSNALNISNNRFCDNSPAWSPDGRRIAFVSDRDSNWEIYVMNADGSGEDRLTAAYGTDRSPAWSPDGKMIAFESDQGGDFDIYLVGPDGQGGRRLTNRAGNEYEPTWSPDGSKIAFTASQYGYHRDVIVADAATGTVRYNKGLTNAAKGWWQFTNIRGISWSPDGKRIAGAYDAWAKSGVFVATLDPVDLKELVTAEALKPEPGGSVPRYQLVGGWYWDGRATRRWLVRDFDSVQWLPDNRIVFRSNMDPSGYHFLYTMSSDGTGLTRLTETIDPSGTNNKVSGGDKLTSDPSAISRSFDGKEYDILLPRLKNVADLPVDGWKFTAGASGDEAYSKADLDDSEWKPIRVDQMWDRQGYRDLREGWYRLRWTYPELQQGRRAFLQFGAVDESAWLYVDGKLAAYYDPVNPAQTWDKPVLLEVTGNLSGGEHVLAVRVKNPTGAGGLWKPIALMTENAAQ